MTDSSRHRSLLLQLSTGTESDHSALLAYVNLMGITALGWRLSIEPVDFAHERFEGKLESPSGTRFHRADAPTVAMLARELVHKWMGGSEPLSKQREQRIAPLHLALGLRENSRVDVLQVSADEDLAAMGVAPTERPRGAECDECHVVGRHAFECSQWRRS